MITVRHCKSKVEIAMTDEELTEIAKARSGRNHMFL